MRKHILLISDGSPIFPDLARLLTMAGYRVTFTFYGRKAFQALRSADLRLVLSRFSRDWSDLGPFLEAVRERGREIALLFLTEAPESGSPSEAFLFKTNGCQFTACGWGRLRHLVTECLSDKGVPSAAAKWAVSLSPQPQTTERARSLLDFKRKTHAPQRHPANQ